jgi:integrase/recombinase XerD
LSPLAVGTQAARVAQVRQFFRFLVKQGYLLADPSVVLETPRVPRRLPARVLSETEMKRLLLAPDVRTPLGLRDRAILELFYATGLRLGELLDLTVTDIDLAAGDLAVHLLPW